MNNRNYRFEVKVPIPLNRLEAVLCWLKLHSLGFSEHHETRQINSLYLDTPFLARYDENLSGISTRRKVRIRWYGELHSVMNARLEFKYRQGGKGYKEIFDVDFDFQQSELNWQQLLTKALHSLPLAGQLLWGAEQSPIIICSYWRQYLISFNQTIRATIDSNIMALDQRYYATANLTRQAPLGDYVLLELKTDANNESQLSDLMATCPLRPSRHSKYVNSIRNLIWY